MKKIVAGLFCIMSMMQAIEIDVPFVKSQADSNKKDIGSRVLLMKYYFQNHAYGMARNYTKEILALDASHPLANKINKKLSFINRLQHTSGIRKSAPSTMLHALYAEKSYKDFCALSKEAKALGIFLEPAITSEMADAYYQLGEYDKSEALLSSNNQHSTHLKDKINLVKAKKRISSKSSAKAIQDYIYLLKQEKAPHEIVKELESIVAKYPENSEARIALAEYIYWQKDMKKAFHTLYRVRKYNHHSRKLYATILYEMGDYEHALYFLPNLLKEEKVATQRVLLKKRLALSYLHTGKKQEADKLFSKLLEENPSDNELKSIHNTYEKQQLLSKAVQFHKRKDFQHALAYYLRYHDKSQDPKVAKEIAEIYYFSQREKLSLPYFTEYLNAYPEDTLIRFHYASVLEKLKHYDKSAREFRKIVAKRDAKEYYLAQYHYAYSLMHTYKDEDWLEARGRLSTLVNHLARRSKREEKSLLIYSQNLLRTANGPIKKPTRYKDIILTEGSYKQVDPKEVFSIEKISFSTHQKTIGELSRSKNKKFKTWLGMDYVEDSTASYSNYKIGFENIVSLKNSQIGMEFQNFNFNTLEKNSNGIALFINTKIDKLKVALGIEHFETFDTIVPKVSWNTAIGSHHVFIDAYYRNGAFINYRNCMIENESNVGHLSLYDNYLLEDLSTLSIGVDINYFEDNNTNFYAQVRLPIFSYNKFGIEHALLLNENIEYNTKIDVCSHPSEFYDSTYLKYEPKLQFSNGYIEGSFGGGYGFKNQEALFSYGLNAAYNIDNLATFSFNCERLQSSFTGDDMTFCHLDLMQGW